MLIWYAKGRGDSRLFGYVRACKPELRVREYELYKAVYCSLCRELGRAFGPFARFTLSYDFTFLAMLRLSMRDECPGFKKKRCAFNPLIRCNCTKGADLDFTAAAMIFLYYKILDDIADSKGFKRLLRRAARPLFGHARKRAVKRHPELDRLVGESVRMQRQAEQADFAGIDPVCEPTARLLSELFAMTDAPPAQKRVLGRLGYCVGKWVYLADALDDVEDDKKSGSYNPILRSGTLTPGDVRGIMNMCAAEAAAALELLEPRRFAGIFENIVCQGLPSVQKQIGTKEKKLRERSL